MSDIPRKPSAKPIKPEHDFNALVDAIHRAHEECAAAVNRTVNTTLTLRNWVIGFYIVEYEMRGADRAKYGEGVITALADALVIRKILRCDRRELYRYRLFHLAYPQIVESLSPLLPPNSEIVRSLSGQSSSAKDGTDIVNIFTRLNTAGRTLTREDIIFAWLKVGWKTELTSNKNVRACIEELREFYENKRPREEVKPYIECVFAVENHATKA